MADMTKTNRSSFEQESGSGRPACDNCKARKTKCDRNSPCSSCVTAKTECRVTRKAPEKRQRVLLSSKYDEAMQSVSRQLGELQIEMRRLVENSKASPAASSSKGSPNTQIKESMPDVFVVFEGYKGDSSFKAHVKHVSDTLEGTIGSKSGTGPSMPSVAVRDLLQDVDAAERAAPESNDFSRTNLKIRYPELENLPMPPSDPVLKLLRVAQIDKQRFFTDVPIVDQQEFVEGCKAVYFATEPYSLWTWIIVNIGLLYLFLDLDAKHFAQIGVTATDIQENVRLLSANADAASQCLRLCVEPSIAACRAIAVLGTFCVKTGRSTIAWRLETAAARMCLDLGLHRLPSHIKSKDMARKRMLFWYVYAWDQGMAFTHGRTATIHHYDVTSDRPDFQEQYPGTPGLMYTAFMDWALIAGEIHMSLFSVPAQQQPLSTRVERAKGLAARMLEMKGSLRTSPLGDPEQSEPTPRGAARVLDVMAYSNLAIVYRIVPPAQPNSHALQCCEECVDAARSALMALVQVGQWNLARKPIWWSLFLNTTLSMVPFVSFIVLIGNTIATSSVQDLNLLSTVVATIKPAVEYTPATQKLYNVCQKFYEVAELILSQQDGADRTGGAGKGAAGHKNGLETNTMDVAEYDFPMSEQDWEAVIQDFDVQLDGMDAGEMATFVEPYMSGPVWLS